MKRHFAIILGSLIFASTVFAQSPENRQITEFNPSPEALHPFKLISLVIRAPVALLNIFVKGGYWTLDSEPIRNAFNIDYDYTVNIDEDY